MKPLRALRASVRNPHTSPLTKLTKDTERSKQSLENHPSVPPCETLHKSPLTKLTKDTERSKQSLETPSVPSVRNPYTFPLTKLTKNTERSKQSLKSPPCPPCLRAKPFINPLSQSTQRTQRDPNKASKTLRASVRNPSYIPSHKARKGHREKQTKPRNPSVPPCETLIHPLPQSTQRTQSEANKALKPLRALRASVRNPYTSLSQNSQRTQREANKASKALRALRASVRNPSYSPSLKAHKGHRENQTKPRKTSVPSVPPCETLIHPLPQSTQRTQREASKASKTLRVLRASVRNPSYNPSLKAHKGHRENQTKPRKTSVSSVPPCETLNSEL